MAKSQAKMPAARGYRMPAEWEPHEATWLVWPHQTEDWPGKFHPIPWAYTEIIRKLVEGEKVALLVEDEAAGIRARRMLARANVRLDQVRFFEFPTDRGWTRDTGPMFIRKDWTGELAIVNWRFNGWAKYPNHLLDDQVAPFAARELGVPLLTPATPDGPMVLEGGAIDVNGDGCLLTTEECLLSPVQARNPHLSQDQVERMLCGYLGVQKILWLRNGIVGDDTHGHVDDLARFVDAGTIVVAQEKDPADANYQLLEENLAILRGMIDRRGQPFRIVPLPMPRPVIFDGIRLPASYANFYIANRYVLVPVFNDPADRVALNTLAELFPDREVTGIYAGDLVWGLGTLHCLTQQQPVGKISLG